MDLRVLRKGETENFRNYQTPNEVAALRNMIKQSGMSRVCVWSAK